MVSSVGLEVVRSYTTLNPSLW